MQFSNTITLIIVTLAASASAAAVNLDTAGLRVDLAARQAAQPALPIQRSEGTPTTAALDARQSPAVDSSHPDKESAQSALDDARAEGRRKLSGTTANCKSSSCHTCMNSATIAALAEIAGCGIVSTGAEVGSGGLATAFVVAGFAACETAVVANMGKSVVECEALT